MNDKPPGLETFVDRYRADFDAFEPRPDLWDAIAQDLVTASAPPPESAAVPGRMVPLFPAALRSSSTPATMADARMARPYGIAATVAALLLLSAWCWQQQGGEATSWTRADYPATLGGGGAPSLVPYQVPELAAPASEGPEQRLASAVQRLETYYATQLGARRQELRLADRESAAPPVDWQQELGTLDSAYQQLKVELYRNPEPAVVLEAMNRNMQIRLDLLDQQLRTRERIREYHTQPYMVADSRRIP